MDPYQITFETWNKVALLYQERFMHLDLYDDTYDLFCECIKKSKASILEIGCGPETLPGTCYQNDPALKYKGSTFPRI